MTGRRIISRRRRAPHFYDVDPDTGDLVILSGDHRAQRNVIGEVLPSRFAFDERKKRSWKKMAEQIELEVGKPAPRIPEGKHTGKIAGVEVSERKTDMPYLDVHITVDGFEDLVPISAGYPLPGKDAKGNDKQLKAKTLLGDLLKRFGAKLAIGKKVEISKILKEGLKVSFLTMNKETDRGTYARVQRDSLRPAK